MKRATARKAQQEELDFGGGGDKPPPRRRRRAPEGGGGGGDGVPAALHEAARRRYLNYALSVITARALPDVRDGLKPVQRRIVFGMFKDHHLTNDAKYQKCAKVVGTIMGQYHPHGDVAIYDALVRMAQDFSLRYPLVDGHGNFGSLDGDAAAAMRYTECRLAPLASELLTELTKRTIDYRPNYDGTLFEPIVVPARLPQLLMNGTTGIAVGMATNIPPHNVQELCDALVELIAHPKLDTKDLLKFVKGPDFPTGAEVGTPQRLSLKEILRYFLAFRFEVVTRRFQFDLQEVQKRLHILEGFEKVYDALDEMIKIIRKSEGKEDAAAKLMKRFKLDEIQTDAILDMRLYKLARLEILVVQKEAKEKRVEQKELKALLASDKARWGVVRDEIKEIVSQYADERRTKIGGGREEVEYTEEAFIADEDANVVITRDGWVKRVREMKDPSSTRLREGDEVLAVLAGSLKSSLILFSNFGTAYVTRFNDIPASTGYGDPVQKLFKFDDQERVVGALSLDARLPKPEKLVAVSKRGYGLRFPLAPHAELSTRAGRRYAKPGKDDELIGVAPAEDRDLLAVVTQSSHALVCKVKEINELAGPGRGLTVIKVPAGDQVVAFLCTSDKEQRIELESGKGKKLSLGVKTYELAARGGKGREMVKKDKVKVAQRPIAFLALPEAKTQEPALPATGGGRRPQHREAE